MSAGGLAIIWRWLILIRASGYPIAAKSAAWIYLVSSFIGIPTPAGMGGDAVRAYTLSQRTSEGGAAVASVAADRLLGLTAILLVGLCGALFWQHGEGTRLVLAIGMVILIIGGHIDLSVGSVVALTGAVSAVLVIQQGMPFWVGVVAALAVGILVGVWQGF